MMLPICLFVLNTRPGIIQESVNTTFHCCPRDRPIRTLKVVTVRDLVVLSGSSKSHSKSVSQHCHVCVHVTHERYTVCNVEGREINHCKPLLPGASNPGCQCDRRACHHCTIANNTLLITVERCAGRDISYKGAGPQLHLPRFSEVAVADKFSTSH